MINAVVTKLCTKENRKFQTVKQGKLTTADIILPEDFEKSQAQLKELGQ